MFDRGSWWWTVVQLKGSVVPKVLPRSLLCGLFALLVVVLSQQGMRMTLPLKDNLIPSIVLGLLLVFRTNTAYDRFWEGRKCWGTIIIGTRNLSRRIWVSVKEQSPDDRDHKVRSLRMLTALSFVTKHHLRGEPFSDQVRSLVGDDRWAQLGSSGNVPLEIAFWVGDYLQEQYRKGTLTIHELVGMTEILDGMVGAIAGCERILKTPIPLAYVIHLKQLLLIYCIFLPFQTVKDLGWFAVPVVTIVSFTLLGIEEIGVEIENPFGTDSNDLPLNGICETVRSNVEDLMRLESGSNHRA
jgi:ion channel-forming bestrophin family protein